MRGPVLIPFWPDEPPVLNQSEVMLNLRIEMPEGMAVPLEIATTSFDLQDNQGVVHRPQYVSVTPDHTVFNERVQNYFASGGEKLPETIRVRYSAGLTIPYMMLYFSADKVLHMKCKMRNDNGEWLTYKITFTPTRSHSYDPFELPFAYAPVR